MTELSDASASTGFDALYGLEALELTPDLGRAQLRVQDKHKQPFGLVHGGIYVAMAASLACQCTRAVVVSQGKTAAALANRTSFLRPVTAGTIHARAVRRHAGRTTWVWEVELTDDQGRLCVLTRMTVGIRDLPMS